MRYKEITEFRSRNEAQIYRALLQQYARPLSDSIAEYNKAIQLSKIDALALTTVSVSKDPMFQSMARTMFRMGIGKKDVGKLLSRDEPADQLRLIKSFSEKNWLQVLRSVIGGNVNTVNPDVQARKGAQFKTPENLKKELQTAPPNAFGPEVENMIKNQADVFKFYSLVDFFEIVLTTMNVKDAAGKLTPQNIAKGFTDFERTVTGQ